MADFTAEVINNCSKNDKEIYGFAKMYSRIELYKHVTILTIYGAQSKRRLEQIVCNRKEFVYNFRNVFKNNTKLKAIIFEIEGSPENVDFIRGMRINVAVLQIPFIFFTSSEQLRTAILITANVPLKVGERIVEVWIDPNDYTVSELEYTEQGYLEREQRDCKSFKKMTAEEVRGRIIGSNDIVKIICHTNASGVESMKYLAEKVLKDVPASKLLFMDNKLDDMEGRFVEETVKWMFDKSYTNYYVCQRSFRYYMITFKYGGKHHPLISCKKGDILPFNKTVIIPRSFLEFYHCFSAYNDLDIVENEKFKVPKEVHALKFSLTVDESNFTIVEPPRGLIYNKISRLPAQLDAKNLMIPVIGFCGELSFMYVKDEDGSGYKLLDSWNGKLGKDLYISFDEEKPQFFEKAVEKFLRFSNSVIHDLIKIMSTPHDKLSSLETFGYSLSSDDNQTVLMEIKNHAGESKVATPSFLMAMFLKEHLKELKTKLGRKPNEIGFCIFDDFDGDLESKNRVENGLKESCQMLSALECQFIDAV